jgi:uncharacterized membrane protein (UPF0182 family)
MMTISTVSYGDINAKNPIETLFSVFAMLLASVVFAYSLNAIRLIIKGTSKAQR